MIPINFNGAHFPFFGCSSSKLSATLFRLPLPTANSHTSTGIPKIIKNNKYIKINADNSYEYYTIVVKNKDDTFKDLYNKHLRFNEQNEFGLAQINYLVPLTSEHSFYNLLSKTKTDNLSKRDLMKEANEIWTGPLLVRPIFNKQHN